MFPSVLAGVGWGMCTARQHSAVQLLCLPTCLDGCELPSLLTCLQAFLDSSKTHAPFRPAIAPPGLVLSIADQCRLRDRSTIMARQLFAEQGAAYAG